LFIVTSIIKTLVVTILYKIHNILPGWFVHLCYSNSLKMAPGCQNMKEFLYVLCTMYHKMHWLENTLICKLCWHDCGWNKIYSKVFSHSSLHFTSNLVLSHYTSQGNHDSSILTHNSFPYICLFHFSTCFTQPSAHHQESQLYQYDLWYMSLYVGDHVVCRYKSTPAYHTVTYIE